LKENARNQLIEMGDDFEARSGGKNMPGDLEKATGKEQKKRKKVMGRNGNSAWWHSGEKVTAK
jgi:hypothetical protein